MTNSILSILIPVYNKWNYTKSCLNALAQLPNDHQIIVFDNGSSDETKEELQKWNLHPNFKYIRSETNGGFAFAINRAYEQSNAPNIMMLNNDIRIKSDYSTWTQKLIDKCENALVGPTMGELDKDFNFVRETNKQLINKYSYLSGWCLAGSKTIFNKLKINNYVGPLSEEFFCYFEYSDLGFRSHQQKIPLNIVEIPVVHFGKVSSKQLNTGQLYLNAQKIFRNKWKNY